MDKHYVKKVSLTLCVLYLSLYSFSQASFTDKVPDWKKQFPKEDAVAVTYKEVVDFYPNAAPKPGEGKVKASVREEVTLAPLKDFLKYEDGLFYYDEISLDNLKA